MDNSNVISKIFVYMILSLLLTVGVSYVTALYLLELFSLSVWLITIAVSSIVAFLIRKKIWDMDFSSVLCILIVYSVIAGITFSVLWLGDSMIAIIILSVIFIIAAFSNGERALAFAERKGISSSHAAVVLVLSGYLGLLMTIAVWVLIWGAWDTRRRRYSGKKSHPK